MLAFKSFTRKLTGCQGASVGQRAIRLALVVALLLPLGEVTKAGQLGGVLHPLDDLRMKIRQDNYRIKFTLIGKIELSIANGRFM